MQLKRILFSAGMSENEVNERLVKIEKLKTVLFPKSPTLAPFVAFLVDAGYEDLEFILYVHFALFRFQI